MIICFSGCGNTLAVARELAARLGEEVVRLFGDNLLHPEANPLALRPGERGIWMFPVYSWGVPPVMRRYIREAVLISAEGEKQTSAVNSPHFMVATMGDDAGLTAEMWRKDLAARGWHAAAAFGVIMPNTYVSFPGFGIDSPEVTAAKLAAMPARVTAIAASIRACEHQATTHHCANCSDDIHLATHCGCPDDIHRGSMPWLKTKVIYPLFVRTAMSPRRFRVDATRCTGCGLCARRCPLDNITLTGRTLNSETPKRIPKWCDNCATCLACFHACPTGAIFRGPVSRNKSRYPGPA